MNRSGGPSFREAKSNAPDRLQLHVSASNNQLPAKAVGGGPDGALVSVIGNSPYSVHELGE